MKSHASRLFLLGLGTLFCAAGCGAAGEDTSPSPTNQDGAEPLCTDTIENDTYGTLCIMSGTYIEDHTLTANQTYLLVGKVFVGDDSSTNTLTIEPGTLILGDTASTAFLSVRRNAKIDAEGTSADPIVFTSAATEPKSGDWGGVVLNGKAQINNCGSADVALCEAVGEGDTGTYGGNEANDNSGSLKYVRIEYAGYQISPDNELNGLSLQGVGSGTTLDYIQVLAGKDDGIEFFGGTVNASHLVLIGSGDDSLDWTYGWQGNVQFVVIQQFDGESDNGIEADNFDDDNDASPRSAPTLSNMTILGIPNSEASDVGIMLREGTGGHIHNSIVADFNEACVDIDDSATFIVAGDGTSASGELTISNSIFWCDLNFTDDGEDDNYNVEAFVLEQNIGNTVEDPMIADTNGHDFSPLSGSPAEAGFVNPGAGFTAVNFRGAVGPGDNWLSGWTSFE